EIWMAIEAALSLGLRGFPGFSTLTRFLAHHRGKRNRKEPPAITIGQILRWADRFHRTNGRWPIRKSGPIPGTQINWNIVDKALRRGQFGLSGGPSLPQLLAARRKVPNRLDQRRLTLRHILRWADTHFRRTGLWPTAMADPIPYSGGETWLKIDIALRKGARCLRGGSSLARLLVDRSGVRRKRHYHP